jgi:hypothetical protein
MFLYLQERKIKEIAYSKFSFWRQPVGGCRENYAALDGIPEAKIDYWGSSIDD